MSHTHSELGPYTYDFLGYLQTSFAFSGLGKRIVYPNGNDEIDTIRVLKAVDESQRAIIELLERYFIENESIFMPLGYTSASHWIQWLTLIESVSFQSVNSVIIRNGNGWRVPSVLWQDGQLSLRSCAPSEQ